MPGEFPLQWQLNRAIEFQWCSAMIYLHIEISHIFPYHQHNKDDDEKSRNNERCSNITRFTAIAQIMSENNPRPSDSVYYLPSCEKLFSQRDISSATAVCLQCVLNALWNPSIFPLGSHGMGLRYRKTDGDPRSITNCTNVLSRSNVLIMNFPLQFLLVTHKRLFKIIMMPLNIVWLWWSKFVNVFSTEWPSMNDLCTGEYGGFFIWYLWYFDKNSWLAPSRNTM